MTDIDQCVIQLLLSGSDDKRLILHDVRTSASGKPGSGAVASLSGHSSWVLSTDISPDGRLALSGYVIACRSLNLSLVLILMASRSADKTIKVWDLSARAAVSTIQDTGEVWNVSWRPRVPSTGSAGAFLSGGEDGCVRWWRSAGTS
jgi:WD repeat-containing protein 61